VRVYGDGRLAAPAALPPLAPKRVRAWHCRFATSSAEQADGERGVLQAIGLTDQKGERGRSFMSERFVPQRSAARMMQGSRALRPVGAGLILRDPTTEAIDAGL